MLGARYRCEAGHGDYEFLLLIVIGFTQTLLTSTRKSFYFKRSGKGIDKHDKKRDCLGQSLSPNNNIYTFSVSWQIGITFLQAAAACHRRTICEGS